MNVLFLTKKSLTEETTSECAQWGFTFIPLVGTTDQRDATLKLISSIPNYPAHVAANYEYLNNSEVVHEIKWDAVCVDEVHRLKGGANPKPTLMWQNLKKLIENNENCFPIFLSGSIVNNKPEELWAYLHLFNPDLFPSVRDFQRIFMNGTSINVNKLVAAVAPNMLRRTKKEVGIQLPHKSHKTHKIELSGQLREIYKMLTEQMVLQLKSMGDKPLNMMNFLQVCYYTRAALLAPGLLKYNHYPVDPFTGEVGEPTREEVTFSQPYSKLNYAFELGCEILDEGENVVFFTASFNKPIEYLGDLFKEIGKNVMVIHGDTKNVRVQAEAFRQAEQGTTVLLVNMQSGAEGLNLQASEAWPGGASQAIFLDRWWNPERNRQSEDRLWRIGTAHPVVIHYLECPGTIDAVMKAICEDKIAMREGITENAALRPAEWINILTEYLK